MLYVDTMLTRSFMTHIEWVQRWQDMAATDIAAALGIDAALSSEYA